MGGNTKETQSGITPNPLDVPSPHRLPFRAKVTGFESRSKPTSDDSVSTFISTTPPHTLAPSRLPGSQETTDTSGKKAWRTSTSLSDVDVATLRNAFSNAPEATTTISSQAGKPNKLVYPTTASNKEWRGSVSLNGVDVSALRNAFLTDPEATSHPRPLPGRLDTSRWESGQNGSLGDRCKVTPRPLKIPSFPTSTSSGERDSSQIGKLKIPSSLFNTPRKLNGSTTSHFRLLDEFMNQNEFSHGERRTIALIKKNLLDDQQQLQTLLIRTPGKNPETTLLEQLEQYINIADQLLAKPIVYKVRQPSPTGVNKVTQEQPTATQPFLYEAGGLKAQHAPDSVSISEQQLQSLPSEEQKLDAIGLQFDQFAENVDKDIYITAKSPNTLLHLAMRARYSLIPGQRLNLHYKPSPGKSLSAEEEELLTLLGIQKTATGFSFGNPIQLYNLVRKRPELGLTGYSDALRQKYRGQYQQFKAHLKETNSDYVAAHKLLKQTKYKNLYAETMRGDTSLLQNCRQETLAMGSTEDQGPPIPTPPMIHT